MKERKKETNEQTNEWTNERIFEGLVQAFWIKRNSFTNQKDESYSSLANIFFSAQDIIPGMYACVRACGCS